MVFREVGKPMGLEEMDLPSFPYRDLWEERTITTVANLERQDGREYLPKAAAAGVQSSITTYRLDQLNEALEDLRQGRYDGSGVVIP